MSSVVTLFGLRELPELNTTPSLDVDWINPKQNIGIEIEVEVDNNTELNAPALTMWTTHSDGSLRQGQEFVLTRPLRGSALSSAIEEFFEYNKVNKSPTAGTHIHVDMRGKEATMDVAKTMAVIVACIEPSIFEMFTEGRQWCGYTNPIDTLPDEAGSALFSDKAGDEQFRQVFSPVTREYKYYGFNMLPLGRYGSVEFRYFATAESADELIEWVQFCMAVKQAAVAVGIRSNMKYYLSGEEAWDEFLSKFFPQWRDRMFSLLPYKEARARYRKTRHWSMGEVVRKNRLTPEPSTINPFLNTRFKKFFATKVKDPATGKSKVVYDLGTLRLATPSRFLTGWDGAPDEGHTHNDWMLSGNTLYRYTRTGWREVVAFLESRTLGTEIRTCYTQLSRLDFNMLLGALQNRISQTDDVGCMLSLANNPVALQKLGAMRDAMVANATRLLSDEQPQEVAEVYDDPEPAYEDEEFSADEAAHSVRQVEAAAPTTSNDPPSVASLDELARMLRYSGGPISSR